MESTIFTAVRKFAKRIAVNQILLTRNTSKQANFFHVNNFFPEKNVFFYL